MFDTSQKLTRAQLLERAQVQEEKAEREDKLGLHRIAEFRRSRAETFRAMAALECFYPG